MDRDELSTRMAGATRKRAMRGRKGGQGGAGASRTAFRFGHAVIQSI